jgi:hypothetical protein
VPSSISKKFLEPLRRQGGVARRILDVAMPEIRLDRPRIVAVICELVAAGMAEHVGMSSRRVGYPRRSCLCGVNVEK